MRHVIFYNYFFRFLGSGCTLKDLHYQFRLGHTTIGRIARRVCKAVQHVLMKECIPTFTPERWQENARIFQERANFPNCLGALDGKHVRIEKPDFSGSQFFNYKKYNSIVLFVVADANYLFNYIEVGSYGRESDSTIFENSKLNYLIKNDQANIPEGTPLPGTVNPTMPYTFIGDEAFSLSEAIMRPYTGTFLTHKKRVFNYRLCRARRYVECAFGILTNKWRIFHRPMNLNLEFIISIVECCCILHNFVRARDGYDFDDTLTVWGLEDMVHARSSRQAGRPVNERRNVLADYFVSDVGKLSWQDKYC